MTALAHLLELIINLRASPTWKHYNDLGVFIDSKPKAITMCLLYVFILVINQLDAQNFCFTISLFHAYTCFEHHVLIIRYHHTYRCVDTRSCIIQF